MATETQRPNGELVLKQVRECDGKCCQEGPRFPNGDNSDCAYRDSRNPAKGCLFQSDVSITPGDGPCGADPSMTAKEAFLKTCLAWPQENCEAKLGETANCCWQWVEENGN